MSRERSISVGGESTGGDFNLSQPIGPRTRKILDEKYPTEKPLMELQNLDDIRGGRGFSSYLKGRFSDLKANRQKLIAFFAIIMFIGLSLITAIYFSFNKTAGVNGEDDVYCTSMLTKAQKIFTYIIIGVQITGHFIFALMILNFIRILYFVDKNHVYCTRRAKLPIITVGFIMIIIPIILVNIYILYGLVSFMIMILDSKETTDGSGIYCVNFPSDVTCGFFNLSFDYNSFRYLLAFDWIVSVIFFLFFTYYYALKK